MEKGRVARALTTLVLLRARLLPLVIDRDLRTEYLQALESADAGDLSPLASLFARLEQAAILQALSVDADAEISHQRNRFLRTSFFCFFAVLRLYLQD